MKQWEYIVERRAKPFTDRADRETYYNEMGRACWELVTVSDKEWHTWKRPIPELVYCS